MERYASKIIKGAPGECWPWIGGKTNGYGSIRLPGDVHEYAHRLTYMTYVGPIPDGLVVDHLCHNADPPCIGGNECKHRACQNPAHMGLATIGENRRRAPIAGKAKEHADKTHCKSGHELSGDNLKPGRGRVCRMCANIRNAAYYARKRS